ncbi:MAG: hydroxymyristoyl-ACP dehydratase [Tannerella sp.]|jgi:predicted hotdog family 3-hydroxylacyl-ACP dehydratase|nr:hydroxymyristoyl-ACP dehydratase [Tannerella sp.]
MDAEALFTDDEIARLIPQRAPIVMLDTFFDGNDMEAHTGLTVRYENLFCENGRLTEPGLIEHIAQSGSAQAGYKAYRRQQAAPMGFIGEIKKFRVKRLPVVGEELKTYVRVISEIFNFSLIEAEVASGDETIASCQMKIFVQK